MRRQAPLLRTTTGVRRPRPTRRSVVKSMAAIVAASAVDLNIATGSAGAASPATTVGGLDESFMISILEHPDVADRARYGTTVDSGEQFHCPSIIQLNGTAWPYAAVFHTPYSVTGGTRFKVNLAVSDDLISWRLVRTLVDNADMPKIYRVTGASWIVVAHEQWSGPGPTSSGPSHVTFQLFYDDSHLLAGSIGSTYTMPLWGSSSLNGTPSFYEAHLVYDAGYYSVDGQYGFHHWNGSRDVNDVTTITRMFDPRPGRTTAYPSTAVAYNDALTSAGNSRSIGQRDTIAQPFGRYNVQEGNIGTQAGSWDKWRLWLYTFSESTNYPTGAGTIRRLSPVTPRGSVSFGNPSVRIVGAPDGNGQVMWVSYFLFGEGAGSGEAGSLIYWTRI